MDYRSASFPTEFILAALALFCYLASSPIAAAPNTSTGKETYMEHCASCHGESAQGIPSLSSPRLNGFDFSYLARQLENYKSGIRGRHKEDIQGQIMAAQVASLEDYQAIADVAEFLTSLPETQIQEHF